MNTEITKVMNVVQRAVNRTSSGDGNLTSNLATLCKEAAFNLEEIKRSVEWANTLTQLKLFKSGSDKTVEFELADPVKVKNMIFKEASPEMEVQKEASLKYPDLHRYLQKKASAHIATVTKPTLSDYPKYDHDLVKEAYTKVHQLKTQHQEAQHEKVRASDRFHSGMFKIASNLGKLYSEKFSEFEQTALDTLGSKCKPFLNALEKMASSNCKRLLNYAPKNIINKSENVQLLKEAMVNCDLVAVYTDVEKRTHSAINDCDTRLVSYARTKFSKSL